ncbi:MAG: Hsp70 family protein, partial [bacterium]
ADNQPSVEVHVLQGEREMARDNRTLGKFHLTDIPAAQRGVPQIEVTFDIDANVIVSVSAKDMGTGKEQAITITSSSGLGEDEIKNMVNEAEEHAEEDKKSRELVEARNQADSLAYSTEKMLKENEDKVPAEDKTAIEEAVAEVKKALENSDASLEEINEAKSKLEAASHKLAEVMYQQAGAQGAPAADAAAGAESPGGNGGGADAPAEGDVVDAEFEEVDKEKKE